MFIKLNKSRIQTFINTESITRIEALPLENEGRIYIYTKDGRTYSIKVEKGKESLVAEQLISSFSKILEVESDVRSK